MSKNTAQITRQYRIILSADTASEVRQLPERCLSRKAGIVRCCRKKEEKRPPFGSRFWVMQFVFGFSHRGR